MSINIGAEVLDYLCEKGYDYQYGARQMQRTIREEFLIPISRKLNLHTFLTVLQAKVFIEKEKIAIEIKPCLEKGRRDQLVGDTGKKLTEYSQLHRVL